MDCDLHTSIPDWIMDHPETASVFHQLGLDPSCGGKSLEYVAVQKGLNPRHVLDELLRTIRGRNNADLPNCHKNET